MKKMFKLIGIYLIGLISVNMTYARPQNQIDMSEMLLKVSEPAMFHHLGPGGFSVYDMGDQQLKFFNWNFQPVKGMRLTRGEGPGQIMQTVLSACMIKDNIFLIGLMENKIKTYDQKGTFIKSIPINIIPKDMALVHGHLYIFNLQINPAERSFLLARVIDPGSGKPINDIILKDKLDSSEIFEGNAALIGLSSQFAIDDDKKIYLLISPINSIYEISEKGKPLGKARLPYKERKKIASVKRGSETKTILSVLDWYTEMKVINNVVFVCFLKEVKKDAKTGRGIYQTHLIKIKSLKDHKYPEKIFDGNLVIIGEHKDNLYLFDTENYHVISTSLLNW